MLFEEGAEAVFEGRLIATGEGGEIGGEEDSYLFGFGFFGLEFFGTPVPNTISETTGLLARIIPEAIEMRLCGMQDIFVFFVPAGELLALPTEGEEMVFFYPSVESKGDEAEEKVLVYIVVTVDGGVKGTEDLTFHCAWQGSGAVGKAV